MPQCRESHLPPRRRTTVTKRALIVGINYSGRNKLAGCVNDARNIERLLCSMGWVCTLLVDDGSVPRKMLPTRKNILRELRTLARCGSRNLFFHYSGHGSFTMDNNGDEVDHRDEVICPVSGGIIRDDDLKAVLVNPLPPTTALTMLMDCCHSGTGCDLRYNYADASVFHAGTGRMQTRLLAKLRGTMPNHYRASDWKHRYASRVNSRVNECAATVVCISGCEDAQTSADTYLNSQACGAMTAAFLDAWKHTQHHTAGSVTRAANLQDLYFHMAGFLRCLRYAQRPQLSLSNATCDQRLANNDAVVRL